MPTKGRLRGYAIPMKPENVAVGAALVVVVGLSSLDLHHDHGPHIELKSPTPPEQSVRAEGAIYVSGSASVVLKTIPTV